MSCYAAERRFQSDDQAVKNDDRLFNSPSITSRSLSVDSVSDKKASTDRAFSGSWAPGVSSTTGIRGLSFLILVVSDFHLAAGP